MDGLVAIALGVDPSQPGIMLRPPRKVKEGVLNVPALIYILMVGCWIALVCMATFIWALQTGLGPGKAVSIFFATLIFSRIFNGFNCRSQDKSLFALGVAGNPWLWVSSLGSVVMTLMVLYMDVLHAPFETVPLSFNEWLVILPAAFSTFVVVEIWKLAKKLKARPGGP